MITISSDAGKTWSEPYEMCSFKGRVYDACYYKGVIYALEFCNDGTGDFWGHEDEHLYRIFTSTDNGKSFNELCVVPIPTYGRAYGAMLFDGEGRLHVYTYNIKDESKIDHIISYDCGKTWESPTQCGVNLGLRNPQIAFINGIFVAHGRDADVKRLVLYTSIDGEHWEDGVVLREMHYHVGCYYSNNIVLKNSTGERMLIQFSEAYEAGCVNVWHTWLEVKR